MDLLYASVIHLLRVGFINEKIQTMCNYKKVSEINHINGRRQQDYESECGIQATKIDAEVWNGTDYVEVLMTGNCVKCNEPIRVADG